MVNMEQGLSFIFVIMICAVAIVLNSPIMFLTSFILGCGYLVIRGRKKGWKLPKDIKNTH
jgi:hypothetical protein